MTETPEKFIPLASPDIQETEIDAVIEVLKSGNLVQGKKVLELEKKLSDYIGCKEVVLVSNGTATLHLILTALGVGDGDEVIVPAFSYIATANVIELVGAKPLFVDIKIDTFNIDPVLIESKITAKTKAIMVVHEFGLPAEMQIICDICEKYGLLLVEDAACALGAKIDNQHVGTFGNAGSFSFHPRKAITSGEGGAISTNDVNLAIKLRGLRNHGVDSAVNTRMSFKYAGFNYRLTDFQAAMLITQLDRLNKIIEKKQEIAEFYNLNLINEKIIKPKYTSLLKHSWQTYHLVLNDTLKQKMVINILKDLGIGTNYGAQCMPEQEYFKGKYNLDSDTLFPNAFRAYSQGLAIPCYEKLNARDLERIVEAINKL